MAEVDVEFQEDPFEVFPEEIRLDVEGLIFLGYLEEELDWCGHKFTIRTIRANEELQAASLSKEFLESFGQWLAFASAHVALALVAVDGNQDFVRALGPSDKEHARTRFDYVNQWYRPTIEFLFAEFEKLRERQQKAIEAIRDLSLGNRNHSWPSPDSFTIQADFQKPSEDIQDLLTD